MQVQYLEGRCQLPPFVLTIGTGDQNAIEFTYVACPCIEVKMRLNSYLLWANQNIMLKTFISASWYAHFSKCQIFIH